MSGSGIVAEMFEELLVDSSFHAGSATIK